MLDIVKPDKQVKSETQDKKQTESWIICKRCQFTLSHQNYATSPEGYHEHMQCNPHGITFVFRCFSHASGCHITGDATVQDSWFPGYSWQYALCQGCGEHLGWYFSSSKADNFFGLIASKISDKIQ